jgi:berberine-like enzyme
MPGGGFQAYGGAIAEVGEDESAFSNRNTLVEFFAGTTWSDPAEDAARMAGARTWAASLEPYSSGTYVNVIADAGADVGRAYHAAQLARLADLKRQYDPDNVFHLNQNIRPAAEA